MSNTFYWTALLDAGIKPIVEFNDKIGEVNEDIGFESGMRAQLTNYHHRGDEVIEFVFDFSKFAEYNKAFEIPTYRDSFGNPILRWSESPFYPINLKERICVMEDEEEVGFNHITEGDEVLLKAWSQEEVEVPYVKWLETKLLERWGVEVRSSE